VGASAYISFAQDPHVVGSVPAAPHVAVARPQVEHLLAAFASKDPFAGSQMLVGPGGPLRVSYPPETVHIEGPMPREVAMSTLPCPSRPNRASVASVTRRNRAPVTPVTP